jgi:hypothetical protein
MPNNLIDWDVAAVALKGQADSGDRYLVKRLGKNVLLAVLDGLGHGSEAAAAAKIAIDILDANPGDSVISLFKRSHEALRKSRGVVMSVALLNGVDATMTWMGVGNVDGLLVRANSDVKPRKEPLLIRAGVLGGSLPALHASIVPIMVGDTLVFTTDGIRSGFDEMVNCHDPPNEIAARILSSYAKANDDALVLVARYKRN